ncbi:MAG: hypothetical protein ACLQDY_30360 [Streptosporangiaceae bacterium]
MAGTAAAVSAQPLKRGPSGPFPHDRCSSTASLRAWPARIAVPDGKVAWQSHGMIATYAGPAFAAFLRSFSLRPQASSDAARLAGRPAARSRAG